MSEDEKQFNPEQESQSKENNLGQEAPEAEPATEPADLDEETRASIAAWSRDWLENLYSSALVVPDDDFEATALADQVKKTIGGQKNLREPAAVFFNELVKFYEEKSLDPNERDKLSDFGRKAQRIFFSSSNSFFSS